MGKSGKKSRESHRHRHLRSHLGGDEPLPSSAYDEPHHDASAAEETEEEEEVEQSPLGSTPSKFHLYQLSVQSPKGDISYMQKFFLMYIGGRLPLHLQEDFCGTAFLSTEWLRTDPRRTAVGLDLDLEALDWCLENNLGKVGADGYSRISLFHGNVLQPREARVVKKIFSDLPKGLHVRGSDETGNFATSEPASPTCPTNSTMGDVALPSRDVVCAFNYSCCCLHKRKDLVLYFKHALSALSKKGGIFVLDIYGGTSSECKLRLQRRFPSFIYIWEQEDFDIVTRKTRISLHFNHGKKRMMRHAFTYHWRLWTVPEIKDCLEEAGFKSVHFWIREMPDTQLTRNAEEYNAGRNVKYEELLHFNQCDSWNAYIVGVANV